MKKSIVLITIVSIFIFSGITSATLWDRGNGLIYDDVLDITWLQDANYAKTSGYDADGTMTWNASIDWADQLSYGGYDDWRLPDSHSYLDGSLATSGFVNDSEMGYMFHVNLKGISGNSNFTDGNEDNISFFNLVSYMYWSETTYSITWGNHEERGMALSFSNGSQSFYPKETSLYAWAVRDGDVSSSVPVPASMLLLASGLAGLAGFRQKLRKV